MCRVWGRYVNSLCDVINVIVELCVRWNNKVEEGIFKLDIERREEFIDEESILVKF